MSGRALGALIYGINVLNCACWVGFDKAYGLSFIILIISCVLSNATDGDSNIVVLGLSLIHFIIALIICIVLNISKALLGIF